jgi:signal transduction histidine kinase
MILAVSRFRVANGVEDDVRQAFLDRPRLVDGWPGFLGLETFTRADDPALFYLLTRWTSPTACRQWHRSALHRESHRGLPKGLRLDPTFNELVELERVARSPDDDMYHLTADAAALLATYLADSRVVHLVQIAGEGTIVAANRAFAAHVGGDQSVLAQPLWRYLTEPDVKRLRAILGGARGEERTNLNFTDPDGAPFTLECVIRVAADGALIVGEPFYDEERRLQRQLLSLNEELATLARDRQREVVAERRARDVAEEENRLKDEAVAIIAHELRQPLAAAAMALGVLDRQPERHDRVRANPSRQIAQMSRLIEDLLQTSKVMRGTIALERQTVDLRRVAEEAADSIGSAVRERGLQLSVRTPGQPVWIAVDELRVRQILANLLTNATKYTPARGTIELEVEAAAERAVVRVRDSGEGIEPAALDRLLRLFARISDQPGGLGIGLAVSRRLAELHDGTLTAHSDGPGRGSTFTLTLPLSDSNI